MCDEIDAASDLEILNTEIALANRPIPAPRSPVCLNADCGEPSLDGASYCSKECCEDHARELWAAKNRRAA
ncbi:hypothetical protein F3J37_18075 [Pantoea sp. Al-1710]|uniref:Uncharacterized protein n=1 Tax=Candidatus Pantoea communis TaxID=2608354 RepID=A0ABX0RSL4_9GAMM|nr:hypothetical protein [Pantoea communis]